MSGLLTDEHKQYIGRTEPTRIELVTRLDIRKYAIASNQTDRRYLDGDEAPPVFYYALFFGVHELDELKPDGIPRVGLIPELPLTRSMAGGVDVTYHRPIRPGDTLVATRTLTDIWEKEGRSGPLIFCQTELRVETDRGEPVLNERATRIFH